MITARHILEKYETSFRLKPGETLLRDDESYVEIFSNPDRREMKDLGREIRFSADSCKKKVFVWNANKALHYNVRDKIGLSGCGKDLKFWWTGILDGVAERRGSSYVMVDSDCFSEHFRKFVREIGHSRFGPKPKSILYDLADLLDRDWSWVDQYLDTYDYIEDLKKKVNMALEQVGDERRVK